MQKPQRDKICSGSFFILFEEIVNAWFLFVTHLETPAFTKGNGHPVR